MGENGTFKCTICNRDERMDQDWVHHISSLTHQRILTRQPGGGHGHWDQSPTVKQRALTILGCEKIAATPFQIAEYLTKCGRLEEFVCPTSLAGTKPERIYCLFKDEESVEKALSIKEHRILRQPIKIERTYGPKSESNGSQKNGKLNDDDQTFRNETGNSFQTEYEAESEDEVDSCGKVLKLEEQLAKLFQKISLSNYDLQKRTKMPKEIQEILRQTFSNCYVFPYSTDFMGIGKNGDSARLCIDPYGTQGDKTHGVIKAKSATDQMSTNLIFQILSMHKSNEELLFKFVSMHNTPPTPPGTLTTPEISFTYKVIPCQVRFENFISVQKSRLIKFLTRHDIRVWPLIMLLRHWSSAHKLFDTMRKGEEFENHILVLLLLFYLTNTKIIPSVIYLQGLSTSPLVVNNIDVSFCSNPTFVPPIRVPVLDDQSIRALSTLSILKGFFTFFAEADLKENVICVANGELIPRKNFKPHLEKNLPESIIKRYRFGADGDLKMEKLDTQTPLCIQDTFDLTENMSRNVDEPELALFQHFCQKSATDMSTILDSLSPNLKTLFQNERTNPKDTLENNGKRKNPNADVDGRDEEPPTSKSKLAC